MAPKRVVFMCLLFGGMMYVAAYGLEFANADKGRRVANPLPKLGGIEAGIGWSILALVLYGAAEVPVTSELAQAFALLILLTMFFTYGVEAFQNLLIGMGYAPGVSVEDGGTNSRKGK